MKILENRPYQYLSCGMALFNKDCFSAAFSVHKEVMTQRFIVI